MGWDDVVGWIEQRANCRQMCACYGCAEKVVQEWAVNTLGCLA